MTVAAGGSWVGVAVDDGGGGGDGVVGKVDAGVECGRDALQGWQGDGGVECGRDVSDS